MKNLSTITFVLIASAVLMTGCKNSEETITTAEGTTITDDANGNVGNPDVTTSPGSNVDQNTTDGPSSSVTNDSIPGNNQPDNSNDGNTGDRR